MSSSTNPPDPYGTGDRSSGSPSGDSAGGSTPPPYGSPPPPPGSNPPAYGSTPPAYGSGAPTYGSSEPSAYGAAPAYGSQQQPYGGGYGSPSPYGQGGMGYPKNSLAVWSLVLSLVGFFVCGPLAIAALITGNMAKKAVRNGEANNGGMATAGIIIAWVTIAIWVIGLLWLFAFGGLAAYLEFIETSSGTSTSGF